MKWPWPKRVLAIRRGYNPNSSSLGFDATFLLGGFFGISMVTAALSSWLRVRGAKRHGEEDVS